VALFLAAVVAAFELLVADFAAAGGEDPTLLVFELVFAAKAGLGCKEDALWTGFIVSVTVVYYLRMTTSLGSFTRIEAGWWLSTAWQWWMECRSAAMATNLFKDCLET
jgi:hypothetical protein